MYRCWWQRWRCWRCRANRPNRVCSTGLVMGTIAAALRSRCAVHRSRFAARPLRFMRLRPRRAALRRRPAVRRPRAALRRCTAGWGLRPRARRPLRLLRLMRKRPLLRRPRTLRLRRRLKPLRTPNHSRHGSGRWMSTGLFCFRMCVPAQVRRRGAGQYARRTRRSPYALFC